MARFTTIALILLLAAASAFATPVGVLGLGSSGFVQATLTSLNWTSDSAAMPVAGPPWNADVNSATTLTFSGGPLLLQEGTLINGGFPFGTPPPATARAFNPFLQFEVHTNLLYTLTGVSPGSANTNCAGVTMSGDSCSISVAGNPSPVVLTLIGSGTVVSIGMFGTATDGVGPLAGWTGGFSATIPGITPQGIVLALCPSGTCTGADVAAARTLDVRSVSGSFTAAIPEPGTVSLLLAGFGLLVLGKVRPAFLRR